MSAFGSASAHGGAQNRLAPVLSAVEKLNALLAEIPTEFVPDFENAAKELFASRRAQPEEEDEEEEEEESKGKRAKKPKAPESQMERMKAVQYWLRDKVPTEAVMPSEKLLFEHKGTEFAEYTAHNTASVDGFLYDEDDIEELVEQHKLARHYCQECGSRNTAALNFISHSLSIAELRFLLADALPSLCSPQASVLLDVGSRLGAVLFASAILGAFKAAKGIEINAELCKVQEEAVAAFGLQSRIEVVCGDICERSDMVAAAQVVVLHNAFQFFLSPEESLRCWKAIAKATQPGTVLVACPSLEEQLACCGGSLQPPTKKKKGAGGGAGSGGGEGLDLDAWVEAVEIDYPQAEHEDDEYADESGRLFTNIRLYKVKAPLP